MKNLRQFSAVCALTLTFAIPAFAGQIETMVAPPPPAQTQQATASGEIQTGLTGQEETVSGEVSATDSAMEIALNLLQSVLALF